MRHEHEATARVTTCDFPRCHEETTTYWSAPLGHATVRPEGWVDIRLSEDDSLALCPAHAHHANTVKLVSALLDRDRSEEALA